MEQILPLVNIADHIHTCMHAYIHNFIWIHLTVIEKALVEIKSASKMTVHGAHERMRVSVMFFAQKHALIQIPTSETSRPFVT